MNSYLKFRNFKYIIIGFILVFLLSFCSQNSNEEKTHRVILKTIYKTLYFLHPNPVQINNDFSKKVYRKYLDNLDLQKHFFLQEDMNDLSSFKEKLDDDWINGDPTFFHITMKCFYKRIKEGEDLCLTILKKPFDFNKKEIFIPGELKHFYPKNKKEWTEKWRIFLKYLTLLFLEEKIINQNKQKNVFKNLNIWKNFFIKKEQESRKKVEETILESFRRLKMKKKSDWFSMYVNTIISQYDPHTNYFSSKEKENFDLSLSGKIEGIGVELKQDHKGYVTIVKLIVGGPAWKSNKIERGDKIIKVAKYPNSESYNIIGMLLENSIRLIRGKKGSKVKLTIQKKNGSTEDVILIRDVIEKKEIFAKSVTILDNKSQKYGLIYLPEFYFDPENKKGRNAVQDMKKIIQELKKKNIQGIILDIRNNGGGSLESAVEISGFFLGKVPIVQIGNNRLYGKIKILKNNIHPVLWEGPLVILVNELSASASEILAAAISDYKRGIIVGSFQTYGKGTVQTLFPIKKFPFFNQEELGTLKLTINKFYRINGSSTQLKGVNSDIVIPSNNGNKKMEKNQKNPMLWDHVSPISYSKIWKEKVNLEKIKLKSINRLKQKKKLLINIDKILELIEKQFSDKKSVSLNWKEFFYENLKVKKRNKNIVFLKNYFSKYRSRMIHPSYEIIDSSLEDKEWKKSLLKDFHIAESVNILRDFNG
ncbi:carboxy terminal-processing peptidase [Blattabacterium cuenoti]|uniref:carboxy terminal-processing peptidase n=1 Tax=Blattabacterium cuenoti TaxID=1653831 RepID=UPI00163BE181|nr:carboxy terminal-processing peptidase [Blattabacterium cuenoti]